MPSQIQGFPNRYPLGAIPEPSEIVDAKAQEQQAELEFTSLRDKVTKLATSWQEEINETMTRRDLRYMKVDVETLRRRGDLKADEIYIPLRVINDNITKEQAQYIAYLTTSRNSAIFKCKNKPVDSGSINVQPLEEWFTKLVRFIGWEIPFFKVLDGAQTHGTDFIEVVFDKDKPGHFAIEHLAHENIWYAQDTENIQKSPILIRNCKVTKEEILAWSDVNVEEVERLFQEQANLNEVKSLEDIQKVFYRKDGIVYVCWFNHRKSQTFIRSPKPLFLGRMTVEQDIPSGNIIQQEVYESLYPIEPLPYIVSENGRLKDIKGRAFFDEYIQEAVSSLVSSIVNAWHRASQVYAAMENPSSGGGPEQLATIAAGKVYSQPIDFFHMDYPDAQGMSIVNALLTQNKAETGQINFAVGNRNDYASRKTAKEISSAESQAALLGAVQVTLFSIFLRNVFTRCWAIAQSQAQQGLLDGVEIGVEIEQLLTYEYELYSAGDSEVVKREETKQSLMQAWPVVSQTPAASAMLEDLLALLFPQNAHRYIQALRQGDPKVLLAGLAGILASIVKENPQVVPVDKWEQIGALIEAANNISGANQAQATAQQNGQPQQEQLTNA